ncbi:MAG: hypothetical protein OXU67_09795, partial [Chloroflexota bacterium]|nr:hypothetical protein [Chloroflexota bacterium]
ENWLRPVAVALIAGIIGGLVLFYMRDITVVPEKFNGVWSCSLYAGKFDMSRLRVTDIPNAMFAGSIMVDGSGNISGTVTRIVDSDTMQKELLSVTGIQNDYRLSKDDIFITIPEGESSYYILAFEKIERIGRKPFHLEGQYYFLNAGQRLSYAGGVRCEINRGEQWVRQPS